ncbi:MAG TPA: XRE family transcriptional regulator [Clostridia bacterium]|nr:XRE family transcriptional regulator [Clostridia bacterium]
MQIGERLKDLRHKNGLTQEELADRSDLTKGFISQIENANTSPSVDTMESLVRALGTNMSDFFKEDQPIHVVYYNEDAFSAFYEKLGSTISWIVPDAQKNHMEPVLLELAAGGKSKTYTPFEGEAFGYVLEGEIDLHYGDEDYQVKSGDCFYFEANRPHSISNPSKEKAKVLWVLTPPNF